MKLIKPSTEILTPINSGEILNLKKNIVLENGYNFIMIVDKNYEEFNNFLNIYYETN